MHQSAVFSWIVLLLSTTFCGCKEAPEKAARGGSGREAVAAEAPLVAFLGDSLSAGLHVDRDEAFPAILARRFAARGKPFRLVNAGVSGDTSAGGLRRCDWVLAQKPAVVVVELGANDGLRGTKVADIEKNLAAIIDKVKAAGVRCLLLGMKLPPNYGADYATDFEGIFARVARSADVPIVPFLLDGVAGKPELNHVDGLHPTAAGHEILADNVEPQLRRLLGD